MSGVPQSTRAGAAQDSRALSLAHRLLAGTGIASLTAYRAPGQPTTDALVHGLSGRGVLVVAAIPVSSGGFPLAESNALAGAQAAGAADAVEVRGEIVAHGPEVSVRVLAATLHFLGRLEWIDRGSAAALGSLPDQVAGLLEHPDARLGIVRTERVLLHDGTGVVAFPYDALAEHHLGGAANRAHRVDEQVLDLVGSIPPEEIGHVFEAGVRGALPARILSTTASTAACASLPERVYWVDVDVTGITLMRADGEGQRVAFFPFETGAREVTDLRSAIEDVVLASLATPVQPLR